MRTAGFAPSLGAGGSLVAAIAVVALLSSALLAFHDWPSGAPHAGDGTATLPAAATPRAAHRSAQPAAARVVARAAPAHAARPARRSPATALRSAGGTRRAQLPAATPAPVAKSPTPAAKQAPARSPAPAVAAPTPTAAPAAKGPVGRTVRTVRQAAEPVVNRLPAPVRAPVHAAGDTVRQVGDGVDGALGGTGIRLP